MTNETDWSVVFLLAGVDDLIAMNNLGLGMFGDCKRYSKKMKKRCPLCTEEGELQFQ